MRIKRLKNMINESLDLADAISKIKEKYSEMDVANMLDNEILEWVDSDWKDDGAESEYDWYMDYGRGEAEDVILEQIVDWYKSTHGVTMTTDEEIELQNEIAEEYSINRI